MYWCRFSRTKAIHIGTNLISHSMKYWERTLKARLRNEKVINEQQFGFMLHKSIDIAWNIEKGRKNCTVFVDLEKSP